MRFYRKVRSLVASVVARFGRPTYLGFEDPSKNILNALNHDLSGMDFGGFVRYLDVCAKPFPSRRC